MPYEMSIMSKSKEVFHAGFKDPLILFARNIYEGVVSITLIMAHFTKYTAVPAGYAFYCHNRAIGIIGRFHGGVSIRIHILSGDLPIKL